MSYFNEPELIEVRDWSVWLRFPNKVSQSQVYDFLRKENALMSLIFATGRWEIRPIRRVSAEGGSARGGEEREER